MASTIQLRRRIKTARNIAKLTRALEMVAASKMRRAKERTVASRPYAQKLSYMTTSLSTGLEDDQVHPLLLKRPGNKTLLLVFSPDRGLCGGLISGLAREFFAVKDKQKDITAVTVGKKLASKIAHSSTKIIADFPFGTTLPSFDFVLQLRAIVIDGFLKGDFDRVLCLYPQFENMFSQKPKLQTILPMVLESTGEKNETGKHAPYLFEPNAKDILDFLLPHYLETQLYQILLESYTSEQASRMNAMHNATENAKDVMDILTLEYNKVRQEKVTNEILDIVTASMTLGAS